MSLCLSNIRLWWQRTFSEKHHSHYQHYHHIKRNTCPHKCQHWSPTQVSYATSTFKFHNDIPVTLHLTLPLLSPLVAETSTIRTLRVHPTVLARQPKEVTITWNFWNSPTMEYIYVKLKIENKIKKNTDSVPQTQKQPISHYFYYSLPFSRFLSNSSGFYSQLDL